jgi:FkbM family methyltransferase
MAENAPLDIDTYEALDPHFAFRLPDGRQMRFACPNRQVLFRCETLFTKEPDTVDWIMGFDASDVFVDVGANVGIYTVLAAVARGCAVMAFEPEAQNFAQLNANIVANGLDGRVVAFPIALYDRFLVGKLHFENIGAGHSHNSFNEAVDYKLRPRQFGHVQGAVSSRLDALVADAAIPFPTHVKIDVDGLEHRVVEGMAGLLDDPRLRSVLVEIDSGQPVHRAIVERMAAAGFTWSEDQVAEARRKSGPHTGIGNWIFRR